MNLNNTDQLLTVEDVATMFGCTPSCVYLWVNKGQIEHERESRVVRGRERELIRFQPKVVLAYFGEAGYDPNELLITAKDLRDTLRLRPTAQKRALSDGAFGAIKNPGGHYMVRRSYLDRVLDDPASLRDGFTRPPDDRLLLPSEVCEIFRITRTRLVNEWVAKKCIPCLRIGKAPNGRLRFWESVILSYFGEWGYNPNNPPLTRTELGEVFDVSLRAIESWVAAGKISPIVTPGPKYLLFAPQEVNRLLIVRAGR